MSLPSNVQHTIELAFEELQQSNDLRPIMRIAVYDSLGPTFSPADLFDRINKLKNGFHRLTFSDRVRAKLAIITAQKVSQIWHNGFIIESGEYPINSDNNYFTIPFWEKSVYSIPLNALAEHVISVAKVVLSGEKVNVQKIFYEMCEFNQILGRPIGCTEIASHAGWAAYEALEQTLGIGPFNQLKIDEETTDEDVSWQGAAAIAAMSAYAGILDDEYYLVSIDIHKRLDFWTWWLKDAIPRVWKTESPTFLSDASDEDLIPFRNTVHPTVRRVGKNLFTLINKS